MSNLDELETLNSLREKGIISQEEFENKKAEILNSPTTPQGDKSQAVYCILAFFLGGIGIHNFYAGRWKRGLAQLLLTLSSPFTFLIGAVISNIWSIINIFAIHTDGKGKEFTPSSAAKYICGILAILWVLLYVFVLLVGGIFGYNTAMGRYKANEVLNYTAQIQVLAAASNGGEGIFSTQDCNRLMPMSSGSFFRTCSVEPGGQVTLSGLEDQVEEAILKINPKAYRNSGQLIIPSVF